MNNKGKITLEEISKEINISRTTIYKILNKKGKVSEKTKKTVLDAIEKYNYTPNEAAKNLARHKQYNLAFVGFHSPRTPYTQSNLLKGIHWASDEFKDHGLNMEVAPAGRETNLNQLAEINKLAENGCDGFVIFPDKIEPLKDCIDHLVQNGKTVFTVNKDVPDCKRHAYIGCDYFKSGILAAEVLARMVPPEKEIAVLLGGNGIENQDIVERYRGLEKKMERFPAIRLREPFYHSAENPQKLEQYIHKILKDDSSLGGILDLTYELDLVGKIVLEHNNQVRLVGFDMCDTVKKHMIAHSIDAIIFQDMVGQGYQAVKNLFLTLMNDNLETIPDQASKLEVVYEGNLDFYI